MGEDRPRDDASGAPEPHPEASDLLEAHLADVLPREVRATRRAHQTLVAPNSSSPSASSPSASEPAPSAPAPSAQHAPGATIAPPMPPRRATILPGAGAAEAEAQTTAPGPAPAAPAASPHRPAPLERGGRLGRWVLDSRLGEGATAEVWSAHHDQLGAPVAIKIFHRRDLPFHTVLGEARAAAGIPSQHVVWVYDVDTLGGHHAIVMELCGADGSPANSLRDLDVDDPILAAGLVAGAARGVEAAHAVDVFHKDIKPANVLVSPRDGRAQITDFGLANPYLWRRPEGHGPHTAQATVWLDAEAAVPADLGDTLSPIRGSLRVGTPEFMAPEQAAGLRRDLDPEDPVHRRHLVAMDVYGLGATLYHALCGHPPYPVGATDPDGLEAAEIMDQVVARPPQAIHHAAPHVPRRLAAIVAKAMARSPTDRYPNAAALADDLDAWIAVHPTSIDRGPLVRLGVHAWRERARVVLALALLFVILGSSVIVWQNAERIAAQTEAIADARAELDALTASREATLVSLQATEATLDDARTVIEQKEGLLSAQGQRLRDRERRLSLASSQLATTEDRLDATEAQLDSTTTELELRSEALEMANERIVGLTDATSRAQGALADTRQELEAVVTDLGKARTRLVDLEGDLAARTTQRDAAREQVERLSERVDQGRSALRSAEASISDLRRKLDDARRARTAAQTELRRVEAENERLREVLADMLVGDGTRPQRPRPQAPSRYPELEPREIR